MLAYAKVKVAEGVMQHAPLIAWQSQLQAFIDECAVSAPREQAARIREARVLLLSSPDPASLVAPHLPGEKRLEAMLAAGAFESAALSLIGKDTGFMLSCGANGLCLASVLLPGSDEEMTAEGDTLALALLTAQAKALLSQTC